MSHHHNADEDHRHRHHAHHDYTAANQEYFDKKAPTFDEPQVVKVTGQVADAIKKTHPSLFNENATVMDFACGTGLVSIHLHENVKSILGIDISQGVVDKYNERAVEQGISEKMKAVRVELKGDGAELDGAKFDVIVCTLAYHHFADINETTRILVSFLKPGGSLVIADFIKGREFSQDRLPEHIKQIVKHTEGFSEEGIRKNFEGAGLNDFLFTPNAVQATIGGNQVEIFLAKGSK